VSFPVKRLPVRRAGAGSAVALALVLAGCGSNGSSVSPATQRVEIRDTLGTFLRALAAADGTAACRELTPTGQASVIHAIGPELTNFGINTCAQVVHVTGAQLTPKLRRELTTATVGAVTLAGSSATVQWSAITSPAGDVGAFFGHPKPVRLVEVKGGWEIESL
jgi:hypothetical protein